MTYTLKLWASKWALTSTLVIFSLAACSVSSELPEAPNFKNAVRHHLDAVETRDLETFKSTLTQSDELYVIFPGGGLLDSTQAVVDFHQNWFQDKDWVFKTQIVKVIEGKTQSTALVKYDFQDTADGPTRQAWLVLTFQLEDGQWRLIHDQNTRIDG